MSRYGRSAHHSGRGGTFAACLVVLSLIVLVAGTTAVPPGIVGFAAFVVLALAAFSFHRH